MKTKAWKQKKRPEPLMSKAVKAMSDIYPYKAITDSGLIIDASNQYQAFLRVSTTDLRGADDTQLGLMIERFNLVLRLYKKPKKLLSTTYKTDTSEQQRYWKYKIQTYRRTLTGAGLSNTERDAITSILRLATEELARHTWVEAELEEQTFFFVLYDKTERLIKSDIDRLIELGDRSLGFVHITDRVEIEQLIFKLCNMNT